MARNRHVYINEQYAEEYKVYQEMSEEMQAARRKYVREQRGYRETWRTALYAAVSASAGLGAAVATVNMGFPAGAGIGMFAAVTWASNVACDVYDEWRSRRDYNAALKKEMAYVHNEPVKEEPVRNEPVKTVEKVEEQVKVKEQVNQQVVTADLTPDYHRELISRGR